MVFFIKKKDIVFKGYLKQLEKSVHDIVEIILNRNKVFSQSDVTGFASVGEIEFRQLTGQPNKGTNFYFTYKANWLFVKPKAKD